MVGSGGMRTPWRRIQGLACRPRGDGRAGDPRLVFALVGKQRSMVGVAGGIEPSVLDSLNATGVVDLEPAARSESHCLQTDVIAVRCATGRKQHFINFQLATVAQF